PPPTPSPYTTLFRSLNLMRSYTTPATQVDADYMLAVSGFSPWGGSGSAEPPPDTSARAAQLSAQRAVQAEQEGYDAFCPFGTLEDRKSTRLNSSHQI